MSLLARYKKQGGIIELVKLIESSAEPKRSSLLNMVKTEDPSFATEVENRIFSFPKLKTLPESTIAEIVAATAPKFLALALFGDTTDFVKLCERCLGKNFAEFKSEREVLDSAPPSATQIEAGQRKLIAEARKLEAQGRIKLVAGALPPGAVPAAAPVAPAAPAAPGAPAAAGSSPAPAAQDPMQGLAAQASPGGPYPALNTFGIEAPPPGLIGERLETFIKQHLGV